jgi:putative ABC transport system ATP-binding protein
LIELNGICRTFDVGGRPVYALVDVNESISAGEHISVMGPSGSGKSTLLNILGCLDRPTSGSYVLDGREVADLSEAALSDIRRNSIGFVFQSYHLVPRLDARGNVELPMVFAGLARAERHERADRALESVGMQERADHRPDQLSGGERQRVAIARATVMQPRILLADEPTGNLDSKSGGQVLEVLDRMNDEGLTLVVVTHDPAVGGRADRVLRMLDGRIVERVKGSDLSQVPPSGAPPAAPGPPEEGAGAEAGEETADVAGPGEDTDALS